MRSRFILPTLTLAAVIAVGVLWFHGRETARALQVRTALLTQREQKLAELQAKRERLREETGYVPRRVSVEPALLAPAPAAVPAPAFEKGEWTPATAWRNAGHATPQAATTTLLWAAANGDLATLRNLFQFDEATRTKARAWFDSLPAAIRSLHATPEDLVTGVTLAHIAPDRAQLSWLDESAGDRAIVGMLIAGPAAISAPPLPARQTPQGTPPSVADRAGYKVVVLSLRRASDGWRVQVPADAIDNLARNFRAPAAR